MDMDRLLVKLDIQWVGGWMDGLDSECAEC